MHTTKPEFMQWRIDYATPKGLVLLGDVMGQFILWHKRDIILAVSSPPPPLSNLERVIEDGEIFSPSRDHHILEMPHSSLPPSEHVLNKPQPCPARIGSPVVAPDSVALGRLSKPLRAQPSNPWTVVGSVPSSFA